MSRNVPVAILTLGTLVFSSFFSIQVLSAAPLDNQQDEYVIFNRDITAHVDEFKVLRTNDKFEMNRYVTKAWELKNAVALEIFPHVKKAVDAEKGKARSLKYKNPADGKTHYFIQVVTPEFQIPYLEDLITMLDLKDVESSEGDVKFNYRLKYRDAEEIANILHNTSLSGEGEVFFDKKTNSVWINDSVSDFKKDYSTLLFYDVPIPQVALDVEIIEIETDDSSEIGLYWDAWKSALSGRYSYGISRLRTTDNTLSDVLDPLIRTARGYEALLSLDATVLADFINYMVDIGEARIVTRSKIVASNGEKGIISSLKRIPYQTYEIKKSDEFNRRVDVSDTSSPGASFIDQGKHTGEKAEGVYIEVRPNISLESTKLDVSVTVNSLCGYTANGMPIIAERRATTNIFLKEKTKFTLGVFDKETLVSENQQVFLLGNIPLAGKLFTHAKRAHKKSKIFVFLTPEMKSIEIPNATILEGCDFNAEPILTSNPTDFADTRIGRD